MKANPLPEAQWGLFPGRRDAGRHLADALSAWHGLHPVVVALPRGGVPVGFEIARALEAPLDVILVRKLRVPWSPETGFGAIIDGSPPKRILNEQMVRDLRLPAATIEDETQAQRRVIEERRRLYRQRKPAIPLQGRTVILVDDGIATGGTVRAAIAGLRAEGAASIVLAVPVAPPEVLQSLAGEVDDIVCPVAPSDFRSVGYYYADFNQTTDAEVLELLQRQ